MEAVGGKSLPRERYLQFRGESVRAILAGQKDQTRRVVHFQPENTQQAVFVGPGMDLFQGLEIKARYGLPGDRLWVRESWRVDTVWDGIRPSAVPPDVTVFYEAGDERYGGEAAPICGRFRQSIFMPRWASRLTLEISNVRLAHVQDISEADAKAEGAGIEEEEEPPYTIVRNVGCPACSGNPKGLPSLCHPVMRGQGRPFACLFANRWDGINARRAGCSFAENPFVFAITFGVVS
jgi:hypothetical protein